MVVHDVLDDSKACLMARIDELHVAERASITLVDGVPKHAVVTPIVQTVKCVHRHQLDEVNPELHEVVEPVNRFHQRAFGRESADVQLVNDASSKLASGPLLVRPDELLSIEGPRPAVHAIWLAPGAWIWKYGVGIVEDEAVI